MTGFPVSALFVAMLAPSPSALAQEPHFMTARPSEAVALEEVSAPKAPELGPADLEAWLDGFLPHSLRSSDIAGAVVVVVKDGQVLLQKGYGYADSAARTPVEPERTLFRGGSVAKLFTWTAVMQLVEQGKLALDVDINAYLDFAIPPRDGQAITLRNLMTHTPGFEEVVKNLMTDRPEDLLPLAAYLEAWTPHRIFPPGKVPAYSNYGAALAGYIVQRNSGETYDDYIERHVLASLGMTCTTSRQPLPERFERSMSKGYRLGSGPAQPFELVGPAPAGSITTCGADMGRFMIAYLQGGEYASARILTPETVRLMHGTALPILPPLHSMLLGFYQRDLNGHRIVAHEGDTQYFHSALSLFPDDGVGVYLSMNSSGTEGAAITIRTALLERFVDRYFPAPAEDRRVDPKAAAEHARQMAGVYESSRQAQSSFLSLVYLLGQTRVSVGDDGRLVIPALQGPNGRPKVWSEIAPFVWQEEGGKERLAAVIENGKVVMFSADGVSPFLVFQPVPGWKSSAWLVPLLLAALTVLTIAGVSWPIAALVRRHYGIASGRTGAEARADRLTRIAALGILATLAAWAGTIAPLETDLSVFSPHLDPWIWTLHVASFAVFVGAAAIAPWNAWMAWTSRRGPFAKLWSTILALACLGLLWAAVAFNLVAFSARY